MEIHQSSLNFSPAAINQRQAGRVSASEKQHNTTPVIDETLNQQGSMAHSKIAISPDEIFEKLNTFEKKQQTTALSVDLHQQRPMPARTIMALEAYINELNHPEQAELNGLISRIDVFV